MIPAARESEGTTMAPPFSRPTRQGRFTRQMWSPKLPTLWIETGHNLPSDLFSGETWRWPNTYPLLYIDTRVRRLTDGGYYVDAIDRALPISAERFATATTTLVSLYKDRYSLVCDAVGKPMRYGWVLVGPDGAFSPLLLTRHPADGGIQQIDFTPQGTGRSVFFHFAGREQVRAWAVEAFPATKDALDNAGVPGPEIVLSDIEGLSDFVGPMFRFDQFMSGQYFAVTQQGWMDALLTLTPLADAQLDYAMNASGQRWEDWLLDRSTNLRDEPLQPYEHARFSTDPANSDWLQLGIAAMLNSYRETLGYALFRPIKDAFGSSVRCGEWGQTCTSKQFPARVLPGEFYQYWDLGQFDFDVQVPLNYAGWAYNAPDYVGGQWNSVLSWGKYFGYIAQTLQPGSNSAMIAVRSPTQDVISARINTEQVRQFRRANEKAMVPSISIDRQVEIGGIQLDPPGYDAVTLLINYVLDVVALGVQECWVWAAAWNAGEVSSMPRVVPPPESANYRQQHEAFFRRLHGSIRSWHPMRNRVYRNRRA